MNLGGGKFEDLHGLSGLDDPSDGRTFSLLDYDRDGWVDLVLASSNAPSLQLYRNRMGDFPSQKGRTAPVLALRFVGANHSSSPSQGKSPRDGTGVRVLVHVGDRKLLREQRSGEGRSAVNSTTLLVGIGSAKFADRVEVFWPSGVKQVLEGPITTGTQLTFFEDPASDAGGRIQESDYFHPGFGGVAVSGAPGQGRLASLPSGGDADLRVYVAMTTHCPACKRAQPELARIQELAGDRIAMMGISVDLKEDAAALSKYAAKYQPAYTVLTNLESEQRALFQEVLIEELDQEGTPSTIITDSEGRILWSDFGVPSVSKVRLLLDSLASE